MRALLFTLIAIWLPAFAAAQGVRGTVRDAQTGRPLNGVFVTIDAGARDRIGVLSDSLGRFFLHPRAPGNYTLRAELIGYQSASRNIALSADEVVDVDFVLPVNAIRLSEIAVTRERRCTNDPERARRSVAVWEEARKALAVAAWMDGQAGAHFRIRTSDVYQNLRGQQIGYPTWNFDSIFGRRPFQAASSDSLLDFGFVHVTKRSTVYYGPDADLLVSPRFTAEHCFSVERRRDRPGLIGLAFEPVPSRRTTGVRGALWLDEKSGVLRSIDYEYVNLPFRVQSEHASGHVSVRQLPNGAFIIDSYRIVMPLLRQDAGTRLVRTDRIRIRSGELLDVTLNGRRTRLVPRYTVRGVVFDSLKMRPLTNTFLNVPGTPFSVVTDSTGAFIIDSVPPGTYTLEFDEPGLHYRAELMPPSFRVDSTQTPVAVGLASRQTLLRALCPADPTLSAGGRRTRLPPHELGVLQLTLTNPDGTAWVSPGDQIEIVFELPWRDAIRGKYRGDDDGIVNACGLPTGVPLDVYVLLENSAIHSLTVIIPQDGFLRADVVRP